MGQRLPNPYNSDYIGRTDDGFKNMQNGVQIYPLPSELDAGDALPFMLHRNGDGSIMINGMFDVGETLIAANTNFLTIARP